MTKLYEITSEIKALEPYIDKDDWLDEDQAAAQQHMDSLQIALEDKAYGIVRVIKGIEADIDAFKQEEDYFAQKRRSAEKKLKWLKEYLKMGLDSAGMSKLRARVFKISLSETKPSVVIDCPISDLPNRFKTVTIEEKPDKDALRQAIEAGETIEGVYLARGKSLRIT
jgi:hypothetical protein